MQRTALVDLYYSDVAEIRRGYVEPNDHLIRYDGKSAIGLGISTISGGNVVTILVDGGPEVIEGEPGLPLGEVDLAPGHLYEIGGRQYVSVSANHALFTFALPD